jgi:glycosyltransferase involved in cell wall biosynthesis
MPQPSLRIVHVVSNLGTYGGERFVAALVRKQQTLHPGIAVVAFAASDSQDSAAVLPVTKRRHDLFFLPRLATTLRSLRPDVVHTHLAHAKHWGRMAAVLARVPAIVHTEHANAFDDRGVRRALTAILHRRTTFVVGFSEDHVHRLASAEHLPPARLRVIPNGIDLAELDSLSRAAARKALHVDDDRRMVLSLARLDPVKGLDLLVDAMGRMCGGSPAHAYLAGDGVLAESLRERAKRLGISDRIHFLGYRTDRAILLAAADAVAVTSHSEAMPLSLIEALCSGVPVVTTAWPGATQLLAGTSASIVPSRDPAAFARALDRVLQPDAQAEARVRAPAFRRQYDISATARRYLDLYEEAASLAIAR